MKTLFRTAIILLLLLMPIRSQEAGKASASRHEYTAYWRQTVDALPTIETGLQATLDAAQTEDMIPVIVTLKIQVDFSQIDDLDRGARLEALVTALQAIASGTQTPLVTLLEAWEAQGSVGEYTSFWVFNGLAVTATPVVIEELANHPLVLRITPDGTDFAPAVDYASPAEPNVSLVNAPALWDLGYHGEGVVVATMDTGAYLNHPDLVGQWRGGSNSWFDPYGEHDTPSDLSGHGTQTLGVILGGDAGGSILGVAPEARWIAVKIFNDAGQATTSAIHAGYQWLLDPDGDPGTADAPHVVNNSWTSMSLGCDLEFQLDLQALRAADILPVFSAGNAGPNSATSLSPANNPEALAVGAIDMNGQIYYQSSRGPSACGEAETIYPEIVAPGVSVLTTERYGLYTLATGTSIAAPHASGALALLLSAFPGITASQQESALIESAVDLGLTGADNDFGYGRLDVWGAYQMGLSSGWPTATPSPSATATPVPPTATPTFTATPTATPTTTPTTEPSVNLALYQPVWVSSFQDDGHDGSMAIDDSLGTYWMSKKAVGKKVSPTEWIKVDLGQNATIQQVVLQWEASYAIDYNLQISDDGQTWSMVFSTASGDGGEDVIPLSSTNGRYIMLESSTWSDSSLRTWLREFQVYGTGGVFSPTNTPTATTAPTDPPPPPTSTFTPTPTTGAAVSVHVGDMDGSSALESRNRWQAQVSISVHNESELPVSNATVSGTWSGAASNSDSCTTDISGVCSLSATNLKSNAGSVTFTVTDISGDSLLYLSAANHDPDGDSDGSSITVLMP